MIRKQFVEIVLLHTGSWVSKHNNVSSIYWVFELKIFKIKGICRFISNGHLTVDHWIWLKVTSELSLAGVLGVL